MVRVVEVPVPQQEVLKVPGLPPLRLQRAQQDRGEAVQVGEGLQQAGNGLKMLLGGVKERVEPLRGQGSLWLLFVIVMPWWGHGPLILVVMEPCGGHGTLLVVM